VAFFIQVARRLDDISGDMLETAFLVQRLSSTFQRFKASMAALVYLKQTLTPNHSQHYLYYILFFLFFCLALGNFTTEDI